MVSAYKKSERDGTELESLTIEGLKKKMEDDSSNQDSSNNGSATEGSGGDSNNNALASPLIPDATQDLEEREIDNMSLASESLEIQQMAQQQMIEDMASVDRRIEEAYAKGYNVEEIINLLGLKEVVDIQNIVQDKIDDIDKSKNLTVDGQNLQKDNKIIEKQAQKEETANVKLENQKISKSIGVVDKSQVGMDKDVVKKNTEIKEKKNSQNSLNILEKNNITNGVKIDVNRSDALDRLAPAIVAALLIMVGTDVGEGVEGSTVTADVDTNHSVTHADQEAVQSEEAEAEDVTKEAEIYNKIFTEIGEEVVNDSVDDFVASEEERASITTDAVVEKGTELLKDQDYQNSLSEKLDDKLKSNGLDAKDFKKGLEESQQKDLETKKESFVEKTGRKTSSSISNGFVDGLTNQNDKNAIQQNTR